ncbi:PP2C family protein-serine/threonine phosphatase [Cryptosporangium minutisporangium]|uniref:PP2C family protein-serine/threonine phosphatase n=1 Tax=Cryptosporangium minutisporangium TaxID=113569 RepID=A0ABP6STR8_9ACTN
MTAEFGQNGEAMFDALLHASHQCHPEDLPTLVARHAAPVGLYEPVIYLVDLQQDALVWLRPRGVAGEPPAVQLPVDSGPGGSAFTELEVRAEEQDGSRLWVTLLDGTERLGVMRLTVASADDVTVRRARRLASLVALMLVSKRAHSDAYHRVARLREMSVSAEVQWSLLPPNTFATDAVVVAGMLEPAYEVGGDLFDWAFDGPILHTALFDAVGHDVSSAVLSALTSGAYRNARRRGLDLPATVAAVDEVLHEQFAARRLTTGVLARLNTDTGWLEWVLAGHPPPVLIRGHALQQLLECHPCLPMGVGVSRAVTVGLAQLEPGDRILFYTDGITEARDPQGRFFGLERLVDFLVTHDKNGHAAPETLRRLVHALLDHHNDRLADDAGLLLVEWRHDPRLAQP